MFHDIMQGFLLEAFYHDGTQLIGKGNFNLTHLISLNFNLF